MSVGIKMPVTIAPVTENVIKRAAKNTRRTRRRKRRRRTRKARKTRRDGKKSGNDGNPLEIAAEATVVVTNAAVSAVVIARRRAMVTDVTATAATIVAAVDIATRGIPAVAPDDTRRARKARDEAEAGAGAQIGVRRGMRTNIEVGKGAAERRGAR